MHLFYTAYEDGLQMQLVFGLSGPVDGHREWLHLKWNAGVSRSSLETCMATSRDVTKEKHTKTSQKSRPAQLWKTFQANETNTERRRGRTGLNAVSASRTFQVTQRFQRPEPEPDRMQYELRVRAFVESRLTSDTKNSHQESRSNQTIPI